MTSPPSSHCSPTSNPSSTSPPVGFEFSLSSSKPALDGFGGGAVVLKGGEATRLSTSTWLAEQLPEPSCASPST